MSDENERSKEAKDKKSSSGALKWLIAGAFVLFFILGGLALLGFSAFLLMKSPSSEKGGSEEPVIVCGALEIRAGASCCADRNKNGVCDIREDSASSPAVSETMKTEATRDTIPERTTAPTTTTLAPSTTSKPATTVSVSSTSTISPIITSSSETSAPATTIPSGKLVSSCANEYGVPSDTVIYVYTQKCCEKTVSPLIERARTVRGYKYKYVAADVLDGSTEGLLKCYLPPGYISVPQLICPANGNTRLLTSQGTFDQIISFTQKCVEAAYV